MAPVIPAATCPKDATNDNPGFKIQVTVELLYIGPTIQGEGEIRK